VKIGRQSLNRKPDETNYVQFGFNFVVGKGERRPIRLYLYSGLNLKKIQIAQN